MNAAKQIGSQKRPFRAHSHMFGHRLETCWSFQILMGRTSRLMKLATAVIAPASEARLDHLDIVYANRAYAIRHGAGPFAREKMRA